MFHRAARHHRLTTRRRGAGRPDRRVRGRHDHIVDAQDGARKLLHQGDEALPDLRRRTRDGGDAVGERTARGRVVVVPLGVHEVLEADRESHPAPHVDRVAGAARTTGARQHVVDGRGRQREVGAGADDLGDRQRARHPLTGEQLVTGSERVAQAQLDRVDVAGGGEEIHLGLVRERHLHRAEPAHRTTRRVVGAHAVRLHQRVGHPVRAGGEARGVGGDVERRRAVRAAVEDDAGLEAHERAVGFRAVAHPDVGRVAVHVTEERLAAGVHHLHRSAGVQREQARVDVEADVLPRAERAADTAEGQAYELLGEAQALRHLLAVVVQPLGRDDQVDAAVVGGDREPGLGTHERLVLHADLVRALDDDRAPVRGIAAPDDQLAEDVAVGVQRRRVGCGLGIGERLEHVVAHDDRRARGDAVSGWSAATAAIGSPA